MSITPRLFSSFKSNKSNKTISLFKQIKKYLHLSLSSNFESENTTKPLNNSKASINPLLSVSHMTNIDSFAPNIYSNSTRSIEKFSHTLLNEP